jgi:hypothetical protein
LNGIGYVLICRRFGDVWQPAGWPSLRDHYIHTYSHQHTVRTSAHEQHLT